MSTIRSDNNRKRGDAPLSGTIYGVSAPQSLAGRFEQQVALHRTRIAVKTGTESVTYDRLNRTANRLAHAISARRESRDRPVALLFKQGLGMITATLATLKTGRPFVQVDSKFPYHRAARIIEHAEPGEIVTDEAHAGLARALAPNDVHVINLDQLTGEPEMNLQVSVAPEQLAYINYTSGSTGEPKGVVSNHRSELHSIMVKSNALRITSEDRISLLRSNNVGATSDALLGLLNGAALYPLELMEEGLAGLGDWLVKERITVLTCVASVFRHSMGALPRERCFDDIRLVHLGGEPLYRSDIEIYRQHFSDRCLLVNRLGISETKTATYYFIDKSTQIVEPVVPVGYPLDGYEITVLDDEGRAVSEGSVGEIAVKSEYLALGYWRHPELTEAKFLADPEGSTARIYLSGDLGYIRPDGCLVHVGRRDFQAKVRGHRVEISEVEISLLELTGVRQAAVIARDDVGGNQRLTAYVVPKKGSAWTVSRLRVALQEKLPSYMIPANFVILDRLPLTANGKIDRRALPPQPTSHLEIESFYVAPRNSIEQALGKLWAEVLGVAEVGIHDDFTLLGGDSLLGSRIVSRVNEIFSPTTPLKTLIETPTVARLADYLIEHETVPGQAEKIADILIKVEAMSAGDVRSALAGK